MKCPSSNPNRYDVLGVNFDLISYEAVLATIEHWRANRESRYVTLTNPYGVMLSRKDTKFRRALERADMTLPDGVGITLASRLLGYSHSGRVAGPILMLKLCERGRQYGCRHYFYGGAEGVADKLVERLLEMYPGLQIVGTYCPPFRPLTREEDETIVRAINSATPDIVWVGLGAPKQEKWMAEHVGQITSAAMIGVGAAFDYHSGGAMWAPEWIRKFGLEWLFNTACQPRRVAQKWPRTALFAVNMLWSCMRRQSRGQTGTPMIH